MTIVGRMNRSRNSIGRINVRRAAGIVEASYYPIDDTALESLSSGTPPVNQRNYGSAIQRPMWNDVCWLMRFDLSSISVSKTALSASITITATAAVPQGSSVSTMRVYQVSAANGNWIEGITNNALAKEGEPCWNAKEADGVGGVKTAWAGSVGCQTAGVDYIDSVLSELTYNRADPEGTKHVYEFNEAGLAVVKSWFGQATNNGVIFKDYPFNGGWHAFKEHSTESYRPILTLTYE